MSLARGTTIRPVEFNLPVLQLPFETIAATMQQYQTEKDLFAQMEALAPQYLQQDANEATAYRTFIDDLSGQVTNAFTQGNTSEGMRALRLAQQKLSKQWKPGGLAHSLNQRYSQYNQALQQIEEHTKDFVDPTYRQFYQHQLQEQVRQGMNFNPQSGTFNTIATPQLVNEVKLGEEVDTFLKGWAADQGYNISKSPDGFWYHKETNKRVSEEELKGALKNFYNQPHIQYALGVQAWARGQSVPEEMKPELLNQAREQKRQQLNAAIDQRARDVVKLRDSLNQGTRRDVMQVQEALNKLGYALTVDGIPGTATQQALDSYVQDTMEELQEQRMLVEPAVESVTLDAVFKDQYQQSLTNAYVPKYAFTEKDLDLIADDVAIARMKIAAQRQMMDALKAEFVRDVPTLVSPILTTDIKIESTGANLQRQKEDYSKVESGVARSLPPDWQRTFQSMGVNWANPTQSSSMRKSATAMEQAALAAQTPQGIDPVSYRDAMRRQGYNLTPRQLQQQLGLLENPDNLQALRAMNNKLEPAYRSVEIAGDTFNRLADAATRSEQVNWDKIAEDMGIYSTTTAGAMSPSNRGIVVQGSPAEEAKRRMRAGDPAAMRAFDRWRETAKLSDSELGIATVDAIINENLQPYNDQLKDMASLNIAALVDFTQLDENTRTQLGLKENGEIEMTKDGSRAVEIKDVQLGVRNINGRNSTVILVTTNKTSKAIPLSTEQINKPFMREWIRSGAAGTMNPNNPGEIQQPEEFDMFAGLMFDLEQSNGTAFSANQIYRMAQNNLTGPVGVSTVQLQDRTAEVASYILPASGGGVRYLVVSTDPNASSVLDNKNQITPEELQSIAQSSGVVAIPMQGDYNDVTQAIFTAKSTLQRDMLKHEILTSPQSYNRSRTNETQNALQIGAQILNDW